MRRTDWLASIRTRLPQNRRPRRRKKCWQPIAVQVERMEDRTLLSSAPVFDAPSYGFSIGDDATSGQTVGTVSATDPDPGDMVMYAITAGDPGGVFRIDFMTGQISVMDPSMLDGGQVYELTVEASDGVLSSSVPVAIEVIETNLPPVFDQPSYTFNLGDDATSGQVVGTVTATDPNPSDMLNYSITAGDPGSLFSIDFMTGQISVMDPSSLNGGQTYVLTVRVSDGEATDSVEATINVVETNVPPTFDQPSYTFNLGDDAASGQIVGTVSATDPNPSDMLTYSITAGDPGSVFSIDFMTGQISVMDPSTLNGGQQFILTVEVTDGEGSDSVQVTIDVIETNLPPMFDESSYFFEIPEDASMGAFVGQVTASDPNPSDMLSYSITDGNTSFVFGIDFMTGEISIADNSALSAGQEYVLTVEVSDGEATDSVSVTIDVVAGAPITNMPPTAHAGGPYTIGVGDTLFLDGSLSSDPDFWPNFSLTYSWDILNDGTVDYTESSPMIDWSILETSFGFTEGNTYELKLTVDDGADADAAVTTVVVLSPPTISDIADQTTDEDVATGAIAFTISDVETPPGSLTVSATSSNEEVVPLANIVFGGSGTDRTITLTPAANAHGTTTVTVTVQDGDGLTASDSFVLTVNSVDDAPTITNPGNRTDSEGATISLAVTADDADLPMDTLTFSATGLPDGLSIDPMTGLISGTIGFNAFENGPAFNVTVTVSDSTTPAALTASAAFTWTVTNAGAGSVTGKEYRGTTTALPNEITVSGITSEKIYVSPETSPDHFVKLSVGGVVLPPGKTMNHVLWAVSNSATPATGNFGATPTPLIDFGGPGTIHQVLVGLDMNENGTLDSPEEETQKFFIVVIDMDDITTQIKAQRTAPTELAESLFPINEGEIFDAGESVFRFELTGLYVGVPSLIRWELRDLDNIIETIADGPGTSFSYSFTNSTLELGRTNILFYVDSNNNWNFDIGEPFQFSPDFKVATVNTLEFTFDVSSRLTDPGSVFDGKSLAFITNDIQTQADRSVKIARVKNSEDDFRAAIALNLTPWGSGIFDATVLPDPLPEGDEAEHFWDMPDNHIRFVQSYGGGTGTTAPLIPHGRDEIIIEYMVMLSNTTIIHEVGHVILGGNTAHHPDQKNIMFDAAIAGISNELTHNQASKLSGL